MKEKVAGILSFLGGLGWGIFGIIRFIEDGDSDNLYMYFFLLVPAVSSVLYVVWTGFGKKENSELNTIIYENQILRHRIEQKELKKNLERE